MACTFVNPSRSFALLPWVQDGFYEELVLWLKCFSFYLFSFIFKFYLFIFCLKKCGYLSQILDPNFLRITYSTKLLGAYHRVYLFLLNYSGFFFSFSVFKFLDFRFICMKILVILSWCFTYLVTNFGCFENCCWLIDAFTFVLVCRLDNWN